MSFKNFGVLIMFLVLSFDVYSFSELSEKDLSLMTSIASGREVSKEKAAAVVSIVTKEDIQKIGAFSIEEVLETVPGLHVIRNDYFRSNKYVFRGMGTKFNTEALFMINGVPIKSVSSGNRTQAGFAGMPVDNIEKIEIIRGPGSALYGADAFSGIINIVMKKKTRSNKTILSARKGELNSSAVSLQSSKYHEDFNLYFSLNYEETNENEEVVTYDTQSYYDEVFNTKSSLAPGSPDFQKNIIDGYLNLSYGNFEFFNLFQYRKNLGTGYGANDAIDLKGNFDNKRNLTKISYSKSLGDFEIKTDASYFIMKESANEYLRFFPSGAFGGSFSEGVIATPERTDDTLSINVKSLYNGIENNYFQLGFGYAENRVYDIKDFRNYNINESNMIVPKPEGIEEISDNPNEVYLNPEERVNIYLFIQNEYYFKKDWALTMGLRYDHYNDFGSTINPRVALVWNTNRKLTTKVLYGRAFRAPSFGELYSKSNPVAFGNKDLSAAKIDTYELSFNYDISLKSNLNWNIFYYETKDQIEPSQSNIGPVFENIGETKGYGGEVEFSHKFNNNISVNSNYSYQQSYNKRTNESTVIYPAHLFYTRLNFDFPKWSANIQGNIIGDRKRNKNDTRSNLNSYYKIDLNITRKNILDINNLNTKIYIKNLTDEDTRNPSINGGIKNDYPMPGRNAHIELSYEF